MRHLLLILLPAALLAQSPVDTSPVTGTTTMVIRGGGPGLQGSMSLTPRVWKGNDGSRWTWDRTTGLPNRLPDKIRWAEYGLYFAAVGADYGSTRYALSHGARETFPFYQCSPPRPGCMNSRNFGILAALPVAAWLANDLWLGKHSTPRWRRASRIMRRVVIGARFGAAAWNVTQGAR